MRTPNLNIHNLILIEHSVYNGQMISGLDHALIINIQLAKSTPIFPRSEKLWNLKYFWSQVLGICLVCLLQLENTDSLSGEDCVVVVQHLWLATCSSEYPRVISLPNTTFPQCSPRSDANSDVWCAQEGRHSGCIIWRTNWHTEGSHSKWKNRELGIPI